MSTPGRESAVARPLTTERGRGGMGAASAYLLLVVAMLSWSGNMIVGRALAGTVPPLGLSLMRWSIAFLVVLPFAGAEIVAKRAVVARHWRILLLLGLLGVTICNSLSYVGLQWTTAINGALVNSAGPMLTLLAAFAFNRERAVPAQLAGILVSLVGVLVIVLRGDPAALVALSVNRGDVALLLGVATWSVYTVLLPRRPPELSPVALLAVLFGIGAATLLPLHVAESWNGRPLPTTSAALLGYLYVGIFPAVIAFFCWNRGVGAIGPSRASLFSHLIPLFAAALAYVFLNEQIAGFHIAGGALLFLGIFLANRR